MKTYINIFALFIAVLFIIPAVKPTVVEAAQCYITRDLSVGSQGTDVSCLQSFLNESGYGTVNVTGYFDANTQNAVARWQVVTGRTPADGYFRASTNSISNYPTTYPTTQTGYYPTYNAPMYNNNDTYSTCNNSGYSVNPAYSTNNGYTNYTTCPSYNTTYQYTNTYPYNTYSYNLGNNSDMSSAQSSIRRAISIIQNAESDFQNAVNNGNNINNARIYLNSAHSSLYSAINSYFNNNYQDAINNANSAYNNANNAINLD